MRRVAWSFLLASALTATVTGSALAGDPFATLDLIRLPRPMPAPDFTADGLDGRPVSLREQRGKVVVLNFWATWCPPCKQEMPSMEALHRRFKDRAFTMIAVSIDTGDSTVVASFVKALGLTFPVALDRQHEVANRYTVRALPSTYLIDRQGMIVAVALGPRDWNGTSAHAVIDSLLK